MRLGILKLPGQGRAMGRLRQSFGSARMFRGLPHCSAENLSRLVSLYTAAVRVFKMKGG
jgi:hypothetical protein